MRNCRQTLRLRASGCAARSFAATASSIGTLTRSKATLTLAASAGTRYSSIKHFLQVGPHGGILPPHLLADALKTRPRVG